MRFAEVYEGWQAGRLSQEAAAQKSGVSDRSFRRFSRRFEEEVAGETARRASAQTRAPTFARDDAASGHDACSPNPNVGIATIHARMTSSLRTGEPT